MMLLSGRAAIAEPVAPDRVSALLATVSAASVLVDPPLLLAAASSTAVATMPAAARPSVSERSPGASSVPLWKTWWLWTATGLAVGGVVAGLAIGLSPHPAASVSWTP